MGQPIDGNTIGAVEVDVVGNTDTLDTSIEKGLQKAAKDGDADMKDIGEQWGDTLAEAVSERLEKSGPRLAKGIEEGLSRQRVQTKVTVQLDRDGNVVRQWVTTIATDINKALKNATSGGDGGVLADAGKSIWKGLSDAIGAGFNVTGRSPLIIGLIGVVGLIGELVFAAGQAISGLTALAAIVPNLFGGIVLQAGVLVLAFQGVFEAISGAFAAKDAEELEEALKNLTPEAQNFVRSLLPLREFFTDLKEAAQGGFFAGFGDSITKAAEALANINFVGGLRDIAGALGGLFGGIVQFTGSPAFTQFLQVLIPSTTAWINDFAPAFNNFLTGLANFGTAAMPFTNWFGGEFNDAITKFGNWLDELSKDQDFLDFLNDMKFTLGLVADTLREAKDLLVGFLDALRDSGAGNAALTALADQLDVLGDFFASDMGKEAIKGLGLAFIVLSYALTFVIIGALELIAAFTWLFELSQDFNEWVAGIAKSFWDWLTSLDEGLDVWINQQKARFWDGLMAIGQYFVTLKNNVVARIEEAGESIRSFFSTLPETIENAVGNLLGTLYQAGRNLLEGLMNGVKSMIPNLKGVMGFVAQQVRDFWPFSPAKEGPLSGRGDLTLAGKNIVDMVATGMLDEAPVLASASESVANNVYFGAGAVQLGFYGTNPTAADAARMGAAGMNGITGVLAKRDTRLAVRAMGASA